MLNAANRSRIGHVLKASRAGLLIVSSRPFEDGEHIRLRLDNGKDADAVEVTVEAIYCEPSRFSNQHGVGFAVLKIHGGDLEALFPHIARTRFGVSA